MLHIFPNESAFDRKISANDYAHLLRSERAQAALAEQYLGMPF